MLVFPVQQVVVERLHVGDQATAPKALEGVHARSRAHLCTRIGIGSQPLQGVAERRIVACRDEYASVWRQYLSHAAHPGGCRRESGGSRLDERDRRALIVRAEDCNVGGRHQRGHIAAPAEEWHGIADPQLTCQALEPASELAVTHYDQPQRSTGRAGTRHCTEQYVEPFDWHEAARVQGDHVVLRRTELGAKRGALCMPRGGERGEIEAHGHDAKPLARRHAEPHEIVDRPLTDADQAVRHPCQRLLHAAVGPTAEGVEVPLEHMAVVGVDDHRPLVRRQRSEPTDGPRLCRVSVDQGGTQLAYQPSERAPPSGRPPAGGAVQRAPASPAAHRDAQRDRWPTPRPFDPAGYEQLVKAPPIHEAAQEADVMGRPADIHSSDHPQNPCGHVVRLRALSSSVSSRR